MRILELFSGTESISKAFRERGHEAFTIEILPRFKPDLVADVTKLTADDLLSHFPEPDVIWASPPCESFSVAALSKNWKKIGCQYIPQTEKTVQGMQNVTHTLELIEGIEPGFWFLENPRGMLRKMHFMRGIQRATITYCQYGDTRMKPTDIWGNRMVELDLRPHCSNGDDCHDAAPAGSKLGTQGLDDRIARAIIPPEFCTELCVQIEGLMNGSQPNQQTLMNFV